MKKLLYIFILLPLFVLGQTAEDWNYQPIFTGATMSIIFPEGFLIDFAGYEMKAYAVKYEYASLIDEFYGIPSDSSLMPVSNTLVITEQVIAFSIMGSDDFCNCLQAEADDIIRFFISTEAGYVVVNTVPPIHYQAQGYFSDFSTITFSINGDAVEFGCMDNNNLEFNPYANIDDGSCANCLCPDYDEPFCGYSNICYAQCDGVFECSGCTDISACNFDFAEQYGEDDGSCEFAEPNYDCDGNCLEDSDGDGVCDIYEVLGCMSNWADNYDVNATDDDGSCSRLGCTSDWADNYDELATDNNGSCSLESCTSIWADNYDSNATIDDGSCIYSSDYVDAIQIQFENLESEAISSLSTLQQALDTWNTSIDLSAGWNMIGYSCPSPIDLVEGLSNHTESILIVKDNNGEAYLPEWNFNGIGDLIPGFGYQIKVTEAIEGFSLCDWYVNDIPEDNIVYLQEENANLENEVANLESELDSIYGCTYSWACNYDETAILNDGSCYDNDLGCGCDTPGPIEGLDCEGNELPEYQVGYFAQGGIVFYVDSTGQHGLVASMEDLTEGATDPNGWGYNGYEWGCLGIEVNGADDSNIGSGYQNTMDIVNQGCSTDNGGITAAHAALDAEINGYSDWYLPSKDELSEMYNTIGKGSPEGNIGGFENTNYYSSSEYGSNHAWGVYFFDGNSISNVKFYAFRVRVIRAF